MDPEYDEALTKAIQSLFLKKIVPENFMLMIHQYNPNVLTIADIQRLRRQLDNRSPAEVNYDLLLTLKCYDGWFQVILDVCKDPDVKQEYLATEFERIKCKFDENYLSCSSQAVHRFSSSSDDPPHLVPGHVNDIHQGLDSSSRHSETDAKYPLDSASNKENVCSDQTTLLITSNNNEYYILEDNGTGECKVCQVQFTSTILAQQHLDGARHKNKIKAWTSQATMSSFDSLPDNKQVQAGVTEQEPPAQCFESDGVLNSESNSSENFLSCENGKRKCTLCNVRLTSATQEKDHLSSSKHAKKIEAAKLKSRRVSFNAPDNQEQITDNAEDSDPVIEPVANDTTLSVDSSSRQNSVTEQPPTSGHVIEAAMSAHDSDHNGAKECKLCDVTFSSEAHANQHLQGAKHKKKAAALQSGDSIEINISQSQSTVDSGNENTPQREVVALSDVDLNLENGTVAAPCPSKYCELNQDGTGRCHVCKVVFTSTVTAQQHLNGRQHRKMVEAVQANSSTQSS